MMSLASELLRRSRVPPCRQRRSDRHPGPLDGLHRQVGFRQAPSTHEPVDRRDHDQGKDGQGDHAVYHRHGDPLHDLGARAGAPQDGQQSGQDGSHGYHPGAHPLDRADHDGPPQVVLQQGTPVADTSHNRTERNRSAFPITLTDDNDIAAAAMMGDSSNPKVG